MTTIGQLQLHFNLMLAQHWLLEGHKRDTHVVSPSAAQTFRFMSTNFCKRRCTRKGAAFHDECAALNVAFCPAPQRVGYRRDIPSGMPFGGGETLSLLAEFEHPMVLLKQSKPPTVRDWQLRPPSRTGTVNIRVAFHCIVDKTQSTKTQKLTGCQVKKLIHNQRERMTFEARQKST